jgi:hypothetical protein
MQSDLMGGRLKYSCVNDLDAFHSGLSCHLGDFVSASVHVLLSTQALGGPRSHQSLREAQY